MSSLWKKQPEDVVDSVLKRAEVSKASEGMHKELFANQRSRHQRHRYAPGLAWKASKIKTQRLYEEFY